MGNDLVAIQNQNQNRLLQKLFSEPSRQLNFTKEELELCDLPAHLLRKMILSKSSGLTLPELFKRYHFKKQQLKNKDNALVEVLYEEPLKRAEELQKIVDSGNKDMLDDLPLLGFIFSIKDSVKYKGTDSTLGFQEFVGKPYTETAKIVEYLESKGALVTCKGNVPQALMMMESTSTAYGNVKNPYDETRTAGGSSGGEGAIIANHLANVAIGSDIGGSLRIPSLFCGVYTLKPTARRLADAEANLYEKSSIYDNAPDHQPLIHPTIGPIAYNVEDLEAVMIQLNDFNKFDVNLPPLPWKKVSMPKRVGIIKPFDKFVEPTKTMVRALNKVTRILEKAEIETVVINLDDIIEDIIINAFAIFFKDKELLSILKDCPEIQDPLDVNYMSINLLTSLSPGMLRKFIKENEDINRDAVTGKAVLLSKENNYISLYKKQIEFIDEVIARFKKANVDCAIAPGLPPAIKIGTSNYLNLILSYTVIWNYLNFPAGVIPVTKVQSDEQLYESKFNDRLNEELNKNLKNSEGMPIGIQIVAIQWQDEIALEVMKFIDSKLKIDQ